MSVYIKIFDVWWFDLDVNCYLVNISYVFYMVYICMSYFFDYGFI